MCYVIREMRAVAFTTKLIDENELDEKKHSRMFMHWIGDDQSMARLGAATQFHPDWDLLCHLRKQGRETARAWLKQNVDQIGCRSTIDLAEMFL